MFARILHKLAFWTLVALLFQVAAALAQTGDFTFEVERYSVEHGLPNRDVFDIARDKTGHIWVSTRDEMCRFDGRKFHLVSKDQTGLGSGNYLRIAPDANGKVWIAQHASPEEFVYDPLRDTVHTFLDYFEKKLPFPPSDFVGFLTLQGCADTLLVLTPDARIFGYDGAAFFPLGGGSKFKYPFWTTFVSSSGVCFVHCAGQVRIVEASGKEVRRVACPQMDIFFQERPGGEVSWAWVDGGSSIVTTVFYPGGKIVQLPKRPLTDGGKPVVFKGECRSFQDLEGNFLTSFGRQIFKFSPEGILIWSVDLEVPSTFGGIQKIRSFDDPNLVWATSNEGLFKVHVRKKNFRNFLPGHSVRGMVSHGGNLLVNTYAGDRTLRLADGEITPGISNCRTCMGFAKAANGDIWQCEETSLRKYSPELKLLDTFPSEASLLVRFLQTFPDAVHQKQWVGTTDGLYFLDEKSRKVKKWRTPQPDSLFDHSLVRHFYQNGEGLWLCTSKGLYLLDNRGGFSRALSTENGLPVGGLFYLHESKTGDFWLGTDGGGLVRWDRETGKTEVFNRKTAGFSNDKIYCVFEDEFGFLWLPSDYGLMRFRPDDSFGGKGSHLVNVFLPRDGLPHEEFNYLANFQASAEGGRIFLGGLNGVTAFHPKDFLQVASKQSPLLVSRLEVFNKNSGQLESRTLRALQENVLFLSTGDQFFEIEFALLDFVTPEQNRYACLIENFEKDWNFLDDNSLRVIGLPPGKYTLRAKAMGGDGQWAGSEIALTIYVETPFFLRKRVWLTGILAIGLLIWARIRWLRRKHEAERRRLESEVEKRTLKIAEQAADLQKLDRAKTHFFTNLTHEFRTPLTLVLAPLDKLLQKKTPDSHRDADRSYLETARRNAEKLLEMVNQLLKIARLEAGQMESAPTAGDAVLFSSNLAGRFQAAAQQKGVRLQWLCDKDELPAVLDFSLLETALGNLLSNAVKYTPAGGEVTFKLETGDKLLVWTVSDTGKGIPSEDLPNVFNRFYRGANAGASHVEGTGIGLALTKEIADFLGASVEVESNPDSKSGGQGCRFVFSLPAPTGVFLKKTPAPLAPRFSEIPHAAPTPKKPRGKQVEKLEILLVEDNAELRQFLRSALEEKYLVREATDGRAGLAFAAQAVPDLIVSDVMMPGMDGFALVRALRADIRCSHVPVILLTAKSGQEDKIAGLESGANAYLTKPFDSAELELLIQNQLALRQAMQENFAAPPGSPAENHPRFSEPEHQFLSNLKKFVMGNLQESDLKGEFLAKKMLMSRMTLHRKLKALTGQSAEDFIRDMRLDFARDILVSGKHNVSEAAYQCGFDDATNFSRAFKERFKVLPSKLLK